MSPEQAELNQLDVDTRSDVYSLGVILYELLTGTTPVERSRFKAAALLEMLRVVREEEAPRPSTRLSTTDQLASIAACRGLEPRKLSGIVRGELDWIVMRCLEKDRIRRYETANGLAKDVERYLADEPVQACPPSAAYRFRKFARRNKRALAAAVLVLLFVVLAGGGIGWVVRDRSARFATAERDGETALAEATRLAGQRKWPEALACVQRAAGVLSHGFGSEPLRRRVEDLGKDLEMIAKLDEIRLQGTEVKDDHFDSQRKDAAYLEAFREYGIDLYELDAAEAAARVRARTIAIELATALDDWIGPRKDTPERQHLSAIARLVDPDPWRNRLRDAWQKNDRKALEELAAADLTDMSPQTLNFLDEVLSRAGTPEQRVTFLRRAQQRYPDDFWINTSLGICLTEKLQPARPREAVRFFTAAIALRRQSPGAHYNLGIAFRQSGSPGEAVATFREALRLKPDYANAHHALGGALLDIGDAKSAADQFQTARALFTRQYGSDHPRTLLSMKSLANAYSAFGRHADALKLFEETLALCNAKLGPDDRYTISSKDGVAMSYAALGRHDEALKVSRELLAQHKAMHGPDHPTTLGSMHKVADCCAAANRLTEAIELFEETVALQKAGLGKNHAETLKSVRCFTECLSKAGRGVEAVTIIDGCVRDAAGQVPDSNILPLLAVRMRHFEKSNDAVGCRRTAEMCESLNRSDAANLYDAACLRAVTAAVIRAADRSEAAAMQADAEADRAMARLKQAVAAGYRNVAYMKKDADLSALRTRDDFRKLIEELEVPAKPE